MQKYNISIEIEKIEKIKINQIINTLKLIKTSNPNVFLIYTQGTSFSLVSKIIKKEIYNLNPNSGFIKINNNS